MAKQIINTSSAPAPIGPYNQSVLINGILFVSGQIALDPSTGDLVEGGVEAETHQVLKNIQAILSAAGTSLDKVVKTSIFLSDMNNFALVNDVYASYFTKDFPARETVEVSKLPKGVAVEISVIAEV
jgi:2-iminobutanoate/2-iminopropanoate deaminase